MALLTYNFHVASTVRINNYGVYKLNNCTNEQAIAHANLINSYTAPGAKFCISEALVSYEKRSLPALLEDWKSIYFTLYSSLNPTVQKRFTIAGLKVIKDVNGDEDVAAMQSMKNAIVNSFIALEPLDDTGLIVLDKVLVPGFSKVRDITVIDSTSTDKTP